LKLNVIFNFISSRPPAPVEKEMLPCRDAVPEKGAHDPASDCRCLCGSLLARVVDGGVELKCRRCKRTVLVPLAERVGTRSEVGPAPPVKALPVRHAG
jgi:hypothetical protein